MLDLSIRESEEVHGWWIRWPNEGCSALGEKKLINFDGDDGENKEKN